MNRIIIVFLFAVLSVLTVDVWQRHYYWEELNSLSQPAREYVHSHFVESSSQDYLKDGWYVEKGDKEVHYIYRECVDDDGNYLTSYYPVQDDFWHMSGCKVGTTTFISF